MVSADSADESLIDGRLREIKQLKAQINDLNSKIVDIEDKNDKLKKENKYLQDNNQKLNNMNFELSEKLLIYEHDPITLCSTSEGYDIEYWDKSTEQYEPLMSIYRNALEDDLREFSEYLVIKLKEMYMVE